MRGWWARLRALVTGRRVLDDLVDELNAHLEMEVDEQAASGSSREEARQAARRAFGNVTAIEERTRDAWRFTLVETLVQDVRYGARLLRRSPALTIAAVLSLAVGIGPTAAIFTVVNALLLRPLPVRDPQQLIILQGYTFPYPQFELLRDRIAEATELSATFLIDRFDRTGSVGRPQLRVGLVSGGYFSMLGVDAALGRVLTRDDDRPGALPVAVVGHALWRRGFHAAPDTIGRTLRLGATTFRIIGVAPEGFEGDWVGRPADIWVPFATAPMVMPEVPALSMFPTRIIGRLRPGVTVERAAAVALPAYRRLLEESLGANASAALRQAAGSAPLAVESASTGYAPQREIMTRSLAILLAIVTCVLIIACGNVASLLLARSAARHREIAVRVAIGAGRSRIVRQLLTEGLLLAMIGGSVGMLLAMWGTNGIAALMASGPANTRSDAVSTSFVALALNLRPDARVLLFTLAVSMLSGVLFGLTPAFHASRAGTSRALVTRDAAGDGRSWLGRTLVVAQVALSLLLVVGAGLFIQTLHNLRTGDVGFDRDRVVLAWTDATETGRSGPALVEFAGTIRDRLASLPGVSSVSISNGGVLQGGDWGSGSESMKFEGLGPKAGLTVRRLAVMPRFFESLGLPLIAGRDFDEHDADAGPKVAIINHTLARFIFGDANPIGRHYGGLTEPGYPTEIIGVVADSKTATPRDHHGVQYVPYRQYGGRFFRASLSIVVRTAGDPRALLSRVRDELVAIDPDLPILKIETIDEQLNDVLVQDRLMTTLAGLSGVLGLLLASLGLYGLMAYTVARRTSEIGVRVALGAPRGRVLRMIVTESLLLICGGLALGLPMALATTRLVSSNLFGIDAADPGVFLTAAALLVAVGVAAALVPANRAARVDPVSALRVE